MTRRILGPFNRVEGDLEIRLELEAGQVREAYVNSPLFRGFEHILLGRPALDALAIVPRICGICSVAQSAAAASALGQAFGVVPPPNGLLMRQLVQATENLADHLSHFYLFFMPDFAHPAYVDRASHAATVERFAALRGSAARDVLAARSGLLRLMGLLAGRWPHTLALQPGGSTHALTVGERLRAQAHLREFRGFLEKTLFGDTLVDFLALQSKAELLAWSTGRTGDFPAFLRLAVDLGLDRQGQSTPRFMASPSFGAWPSGIWEAGTLRPLDIDQITEDVSHAWLRGAQPLPPAAGETRIEADKPAGYTWCKAPRYGGQTVEVGALARQLIAGDALVRDCLHQEADAPYGTVLARVLARMRELAKGLLLMNAWLAEIRPGEPFCLPVELRDQAEGIGLVEAARGTLGHWLSIRNGRIERYQIIAPTTWNFSPRDTQGQPGPLEQALTGLPAGETAPPTVQHVVRSFDPCMACTVH